MAIKALRVSDCLQNRYTAMNADPQGENTTWTEKVEAVKQNPGSAVLKQGTARLQAEKAALKNQGDRKRERGS